MPSSKVGTGEATSQPWGVEGIGGGLCACAWVCVCVCAHARARARADGCVCVWGFRSLIQVELEHVDELNQGLNSHVLLLLFQVQKCSGNLNLEILFGPKKSEPYFVFGAGSVNPSEVSAEVS